MGTQKGERVMTLYENGKDREQQGLAAFQYERHMRTMGCTQLRPIETPQHRAEHYDFEIREGEQGQLWTGVMEVKCRRVSSRQVEDWGSILIEVERLAAMREQFCHTSGTTGKVFWSKNVVFLWRCVKDEVCFAINIDDVIRHWPELEDAPEEMMKGDHGKIPANKAGKLIPVELLERFQ